MPDASGRLTNYDYAATVRPKSELPEFAFSPRVSHDPVVVERVTHPEPMLGPLLPAKRLTKGQRFGKEAWCEVGPRTPTGVGKADPVWDTAFNIKFVRNRPTDASELVQPIGTVPPSPRLAELEYLIETQNQDLAPEYEVFVANGLAARRIEDHDDSIEDDDGIVLDDDGLDITSSALVGTPYAVRIADGVYGGATYIAKMRRRIEWEKWLAACGPVHRAKFQPTDDGQVGVAAFSKNRDHEFLLALRRHVKNTWLDRHADLPDVTDIVAVETRYKGARILDFIEPDEHAAAAAYWAEEDRDPGRVPFHADPTPQPLREQYPYGNCPFSRDYDKHLPNGRCTKKDDVVTHRSCTTDGFDLYKLDFAVWEHAEIEAGRIGYAGPAGLLGLDAKPTDYNHFLREEEVDEFESS